MPAAMAIVMKRAIDGGRAARTGAEMITWSKTGGERLAFDAAKMHAAISIFFIGREGRNGPG